eukprot:2234553-Amphidinium_carterae.1
MPQVALCYSQTPGRGEVEQTDAMTSRHWQLILCVLRASTRPLPCLLSSLGGATRGVEEQDV